MRAIFLCTATLSIAILGLITPAPAFAEDVKDALKAEPAHYKLAFENEAVAVINVHYGPHEKSKLHSHPGGVVVALTAGHLRFTDEDGKTREVQTLRGEARWFPPLKHTVENLGNTSYDGIYIAVKQAHKSASATAPSQQETRAAIATPDKSPIPSPGTAERASTLVHK
jgi:quercetin dioxygenase-like cupin family protein